MKLLGLLLCLLSSALVIGCASSLMYKEFDVQSTYITWVRKAPTMCGTTPENTGCAEWSLPRSKDINGCVITVAEGMPEWVYGHEFLHCFGYQHEAGRIKIK